MIEGKKKETLQETVVRNPSVNSNVTARNLRTNDLGGVIFGCTRHTMKECLSNQIFGLPSSHMVYVKNVKPGLPLFLFNYSDRKIHGIYEAASNGEMNINPYGWTEDGQDRTQNPAQVRICIRKQCMPLSENQYKPIVIDNYYAEDYFWFELDHAQTGQLISLFQSLPVAVSVYPQNADKQNWASKLGKKVKSSETVSDSVVTQLIQHEVADESQAKLPQYSSGWNVLRDMSSDPCENKEDSAGTSDLEDDTPWDERNNFELGLSSATLCEDVKNFEPDSDKVEEVNEEELVYREATLCEDVKKLEPGLDKVEEVNVEELVYRKATLCEDVKNLEPGLDEVEEVNEEELVYRKLLQLVNEREKARCDLTGVEDNVGVSCDLNPSPADFNCEPDALLVNSQKHEVVSTNSSDTRFSSPTSLDVQSFVDQLRQELEEVKVQQLQKASLLETKLTKAEIHVQQLIERVKELESQLIPSTTYVESLETCSADKSQLIPSTAYVESLETCSADKSQLIPSTAHVESLETCSADTMDMEEFLGSNKLVFLFGGYDGTTWLSNVDCYSPLSDTKKRLGSTNLARSHAAAAAFCGDIYIIGGGDGTVWCNTVESYNPQRNEWTSRPSLARNKGCLSGVTLGNKIYAIGGGDGVSCFSDVEMFDPALGRWIPTQSMLQKRFSSAVAELNGAIYAAGGFDGEGYLSSAERFDPREVVSWSSIPSMNTRRGCHSLVAMNEKIYALGGYNGANMVSSVEEFDPRNNSWITRDEMKEARGYATAAVFGDSIFVISGLKDGKMLTETVECYKEGQGWSVANLKGAGKRCFFSAVCM